MIIDARNVVGPEYGRLGSTKAVINHVLDGIEVGQNVHVEAMNDVTGRPVPWERLNMYVSALKGNRTFKIRKVVSADGYEIHRVA